MAEADYTPSMHYFRRQYANRFTEEADVIAAEARFDAALAAHDAEVRASVLADMRWLADARDGYTDERVQFQTASVRQVADIIDGTNDGFGWLPSWRWEAWTARLRLSGRVPVEQGDET